MNRALALWRWAGVGLVWDACQPDPDRVQAEIIAPQPEAVHVHYHLHLPPGMSAEGLSLALPQQRNVITTTTTEATDEAV